MHYLNAYFTIDVLMVDFIEYLPLISQSFVVATAFWTSQQPEVGVLRVFSLSLQGMKPGFTEALHLL